MKNRDLNIVVIALFVFSGFCFGLAIGNASLAPKISCEEQERGETISRTVHSNGKIFLVCEVEQ